MKKGDEKIDRKGRSERIVLREKSIVNFSYIYIYEFF